MSYARGNAVFGLSIIFTLATLLDCIFVGQVYAAPTSQVTFNNFNGTYHLSRDSAKVSLLTAQEVIEADFPPQGYYGVKRILPSTYQGHPVHIKIDSVTDISGTAIPYTSSSDGTNLTITTGDPSITLIGEQTIILRYQTTGVVDITAGGNQFLLDVNGKGWDQPFPNVTATLYIPNSFASAIIGAPSCYVSLDNSTDSACDISAQHTQEATVISAKATNVAAHQSLVIQLGFKSSTFANYRGFSSKTLVMAGLVVTVLVLVPFLIYYRHKNLFNGSRP